MRCMLLNVIKAEKLYLLIKFSSCKETYVKKIKSILILHLLL